MKYPRPILYLSSDEKYGPMDVNHYMDLCCLKDKRTHETLVDFPLSDKSLEQFSRTHKDSRYHYMTPMNKDIAYKGTDNASVYYRVHEEGEYTRVLYSFFFPYNSGYDIPLIGLKGEHEADWEHVSFYYKGDQLIKARYSAHGDMEGQWLTSDELEYRNGRPVIYFATGSHACFQSEETWFRVYGLANDITDRGREWVPSHWVEMPETEEESLEHNLYWLYFKGHFGKDGISSPRSRDWWSREPEHDANFLHRALRIHEIEDVVSDIKEDAKKEIDRLSRDTRERLSQSRREAHKKIMNFRRMVFK
jgi:hypothetical protein